MKVMRFGSRSYKDIWLAVLKEVMTNGTDVYMPDEPGKGKRSGGHTKEVQDLVIEITNPYLPDDAEIHELVTSVGAKFIDNMLINPNTPQFDRIIANGQYYNLIKRLSQNKFSRRAVFTVFLPEDILTEYGVCAIAGQFLYRHDRLSLRVFMRSNDAYNAFPLNTIGFIKLLHKTANNINAEVGTYIHYATSMHIYEHDFNSVKKLLNP